MDAVTEHRPLRKWIVLIFVWIVGLAVFAVYFGMICYTAYRWLS